jgi:hypothetical protein
MSTVNRNLAIAFFVSLAANFFLGGILLANHLHSKVTPLSETAAKFSESDRKILTSSMKEMKSKMKDFREELEDIRKDVKAAMHADPFVQEDLDAVLKIEQEKKKEILKMMSQEKGRVLQKLSPEGRITLQRMAPLPSPNGYIVRMKKPPGDENSDFPLVWDEWDYGLSSSPGDSETR